MQETPETGVRSLGREDPLEKEMATHSSILARETPWQRSREGWSPWGRKESDTTEHTRWTWLCRQYLFIMLEGKPHEYSFHYSWYTLYVFNSLKCSRFFFFRFSIIVKRGHECALRASWDPGAGVYRASWRWTMCSTAPCLQFSSVKSTSSTIPGRLEQDNVWSPLTTVLDT